MSTMSKLAIGLTTLTLTFGSLPVFAADPSPASSPAAAEEKTTVTKSGLQYIDKKVGTGPVPKNGQTVSIDYTITVGDKKIESSPLGQPMVFTLGKDQALKGLEEGVSTMRVGGQRKLLVPPTLGYGNETVAKVPPNSLMVIDVELLEIK